MATDLEKLMAQMPNAGAEMPTLTGNANPLAAGMAMNAPAPPLSDAQFPTLNQIGQNTAAQVNAPPLSGAQFPGLNQIGQETEMLANAEAAAQPFDPVGFFGQRAGAQTTTPQVESPFTANPALEGMDANFARQMNVPAEVITQPSTQQSGGGQAAPVDFSRMANPVTDQTPAATVATGAPPTAAPAPQVPATTGGTITRDATGEVFDVQQPTGALKTYEDRLKETIAAGGQTPQMIAQAASEASPSASPAQVALAQKEAFDRQADIRATQAAEEYGKSLGLGGGSIAARDEKIAGFKAAFMANQEEFDPASVQGAGKSADGISIRDQIAISAEQRAQRKEAGEERAAQGEASDSLANATAAAQGLAQQFTNIEEVAGTAKAQSLSPFTTGLGGMLMSLKPASKASDMRANLDTLTADSAFSALQAMRDASKTGGALGQISERELALLGAAKRSLSANQSDAQLRKNITSYINQRNKLMKDAKRRFASDYGEQAASSAFGDSGGQSQSGAIPNDRNVASASDSLLSSGKY